MDSATKWSFPSAARMKSSGWPWQGRYFSTRNLLTKNCSRQTSKSGQAICGRQQRLWCCGVMADAPSLNGSGSSRKSRYWHKYITLLQQDTGGFQVCAPVENERTSRAVAMRKQGAWARWEQWKTRSHRLHCGRLCPSASNPLTRLSTMFYQGHSICSAGGKWSQELASCAQRQGLLSTSSAAVWKPWVWDATTGTMTNLEGERKHNV